jgi:hypothetical protein
MNGSISFGMDVELMEKDDVLDSIAYEVLLYSDSIEVELEDESDILESLKKEATNFNSLLFAKVKSLRYECQSYYYEAENLGGEEIVFWGNLIFTDNEGNEHVYKLQDVYEDYPWNDNVWD